MSWKTSEQNSSATNNNKSFNCATVKDKVVQFESVRDVASQRSVKDRIQMFERKQKTRDLEENCTHSRQELNTESDVSGDNNYNKSGAQYSARSVLRVPPIIIHRNDDAANRGNKKLDPPRLPEPHPHYLQELDETSDIIIKQTNVQTSCTEEIPTKPLWMGREYLKQLSTEELLSNFRIIEKLRNSYIEEINESGATNREELSSPEPLHDIAIYREENERNYQDNEFGLSELREEEGNYIVEAYNVPDNELVISQLEFDHQESEGAAAALDAEIPKNADTESESDFNKRDSQYSDDSENIYMRLEDCRSGAPLMSDNAKGRDLQIQVAVSWNGSDDEGDKFPRKVRMSYGESDDDNRRKCVHLEQIVYRIEELVTTEEKYVSDLEKIVKHYMPYMQKVTLTENLQGKQQILFGNISEIYAASKVFLKSLKACGYDHEKIAETFLKFKTLFQLYPLYSKNKPEADAYLPHFKSFARGKQEELGERLDLGSYLLTPIQRLGKYKLLLKGINKELNKKHIFSTTVEAALSLVERTASRANDYIAIESIKRCPVDLSREAGSLVMREQFNVVYPNRHFNERSSQGVESMVFFFEEIIVFTMETNKDKKETFAYVDSIKMSDMIIIPSETDEPLILKLEDYSKRNKRLGKQYVYILQAKSPRMKQIWTDNIEKRLWEQANSFREKVKAEYREKASTLTVLDPSKHRQKVERTKTLPERSSRRRKKTKSSTFYIRLA